MNASIDALEERLGHRFKNKELLTRALTHKSRAFETGPLQPDRLADNEQFEFLGDAILGFVVSELLVVRHPGFPEGRLSKLKAFLVSSNHLHGVARRLDLGDFLFLGRGEELSGGRSKRALLANAVEALIAALYVDSGFEAARRFVVDHVVADFNEERGEDESLVVDYKSALQEAATAMGLSAPRYVIAKESGPEHKKTFTVEARIGQVYAERAEGTSKKAAGQRAAQLVLEKLNRGDGAGDTARS
ncbi:MAG: ribonuclease III [Bryobacteraceae bacterium]